MKHQKEIIWIRLDNASKIFPAACSEKDTKVFRIACELYEAVDPQLLQEALDRTLENFPLYRSVLRRGAFWYYLESSEIRPVVRPESNPVCAPIYIGHRRNLLFRVFYFKTRINLEVFHALSDGTGGLWFMQSLVCHYLTLAHKDAAAKPAAAARMSSVSNQMDDSFEKHFIGGNLFHLPGKNDQNRRKVSAYHIRGTRMAEHRIKLIEGTMSTTAVLDQAHAYHTTLTILIASLLVCSVYKQMPARRKNHPVVLSVPVNLRQYFESATARNFFSTMHVDCHSEWGEHDLKTVIQMISERFQKNLTEEQLNHQLNKLMALERSPFTRVIPLPLKDLILRIAAKHTDRQITSAISNVGQISMPPELNAMIRQFSVCTSAQSPRVTLCSYGDRMVISFTSPFAETDIQSTFFQLLSSLGIEIEISSNL